MHADSRTRRLGARLLLELPEQAPGLCRRLLERRELGLRRRTLRSGEVKITPATKIARTLIEKRTFRGPLFSSSKSNYQVPLIFFREAIALSPFPERIREKIRRKCQNTLERPQDIVHCNHRPTRCSVSPLNREGLGICRNCGF